HHRQAAGGEGRTGPAADGAAQAAGRTAQPAERAAPARGRAERPMTRSRALRRLLLAMVAGYLLLVALAWALQGRLIHLPLRELVATPANAGLAYREQWIDTADGERLHGWFLPAPQARGSLLFLHGNAGNISRRLESLQ